MAGAKGEKDRKQVEAKITDDERLFQAEAWFDIGYQYNLNREYGKAIETYTNSILLDPNHAATYYHRGIEYVYFGKGDSEKAISDFQKACDMGYEKGCAALTIALGSKRK